MPLEVTPPPFAASQRLPYTPQFARPEVAGHGSAASSIGPAGGPASAAAAAIIPPAPGGIADPHRAIPALAEAGYTAPNLRPAPISVDPRMGGGASIYGGGSMYGGGARGPPSNSYSYDPPTSAIPHHEHHHHHIQSPISVVHSDGWQANSLPAPRRGPPLIQPESTIAPFSRQQHHQHQHQHHHHMHEDFDDGKSDTSYYGLPKNEKPRSRSGSVSSLSDSTTPRELAANGTHRARSISNHQRSPSMPAVAHLHSPISPSPLAGTPGQTPHASGIGRSPLSPVEVEIIRRHRERASPGPVEEERRPRIHSFVPPEEDEHVRDQARDRRNSALIHETEKAQLKQQTSAHGHGHGHGHGHHHHGHHRHRSGSHLPVPPPSDYSYSSSSYRERVPSPPPNGLGLHLHPDAVSNSGRRRAMSMQTIDRERPYQFQGYQTPSIAGGGAATVYDDGASVISDSRMTFMDGSVAGKTSQYGLPKYPHQPKMDYRR
nr:uncharacterized protein I206_00902 [Kwoniella pini CBS 10737]OCF53597.1 hypothetical protein I206_00902 [Kwoniella pini CBS 10737]